MPERKIILVAKRIHGDWWQLSREEDQPFVFHLKGPIRSFSGPSHLLCGQQEASLQVFPGETVIVEEEVQG